MANYFRAFFVVRIKTSHSTRTLNKFKAHLKQILTIESLVGIENVSLLLEEIQNQI